MHNTPKKVDCIGCIWVTKTASCLQKWHLDYKSCVSLTNIKLSNYKVAFRDTKLHLALQLSTFCGVLRLFFGVFNQYNLKFNVFH